jgi:hypothetical protein
MDETIASLGGYFCWPGYILIARARRASRLILPFGRLWYYRPDNAIGYVMHSSRSHDAVISVYDAAGNMIETLEHAGDFKEW